MDQVLLRRKKTELIRVIRARGSLLVAFSGGVDSSFLLAAAQEALGEGVLAVTAESIIHPPGESAAAQDFALTRGIPHRVISSDEMSLPGFLANGVDRCYHCKRRLFETLLRVAGENGKAHLAHGANLDDLGDYRPGQKAADELGAIAPLIEAQLNKEEIRALSREMGLSTWDRQPSPCLATRIPYGIPVTVERLRMIREAESFLLRLGMREVRVRHHESVARVEVGESEIERLLEKGVRDSIVEALRKVGFTHVALDLEGYRSGKMNRSIT